MHPGEFNSVEAELREIEEDFASGHMDAFGTSVTKEKIVRELRKIAEIETQVFYKTCGLLGASLSEDHLMRTMMFSNSETPPSPSGKNSEECSAGVSQGLGHPYDNSNSNEDNNLGKTTGNSFCSTARMSVFSGTNSTEHRRGSVCVPGGPGPNDATSPPWCSDAGFSDRPFQDVSWHFKVLEGEFSAIGEHLRRISAHVLHLNDIAERARNTGSSHSA